MNGVTKIGNFDQNRMLEEIQSLSIDEDQFCLQGVKGIDDYLYGSRKIDEMNHSEEEFTEFLFDLPYTNSLLKKFNVYRARVMSLPKKYCMTYHYDPTNRIHFPLISNEDFFFIVDDFVYRMNEQNSVYILEATKKHTAANASLKTRIHVIGCINE